MPRRFRRSSRERTEWIGAIQVTPTSVAVNTNAVTDLVNAAAFEEWPGGRLDRLIGHMFISPATAPAGATGYGVFVGFSIREVGTAAANYDPELAPDHRWIHWEAVYPQIGGNAAADSNASRWIGYFRLGFDFRIRRRYGVDRSFSLMVKNSNSSGAAIQYSYAFRMLIAAGAK